MKTRLEVPDPEIKVAVLFVEPVSSSRVGVPPVVTTVTASVKATVIVIESPALYEPSAVEEVTPVIVGAVVSITKALLSAKEPEAPGELILKMHYSTQSNNVIISVLFAL